MVFELQSKFQQTYYNDALRGSQTGKQKVERL